MADTRRSLAETVTQKAVLQEAGAGGRGGEGHQKIIWIDFLVYVMLIDHRLMFWLLLLMMIVVKYQVLNGYYMYSTSPLMFLMLSSM